MRYLWSIRYRRFPFGLVNALDLKTGKQQKKTYVFTYLSIIDNIFQKLREILTCICCIIWHIQLFSRLQNTSKLLDNWTNHVLMWGINIKLYGFIIFCWNGSNLYWKWSPEPNCKQSKETLSSLSSSMCNYHSNSNAVATALSNID